jgi:hypothetical protein
MTNNDIKLQQAAQMLAHLNDYHEGAGLVKMKEVTMAKYLGLSLEKFRSLNASL